MCVALGSETVAILVGLSLFGWFRGPRGSLGTF